jgi:hypothetical protein
MTHPHLVIPLFTKMLPPGADIDTILARLQGCDWGHLVGLANDRRPCQEQATAKLALHGRVSVYHVQLCTRHYAVALHHTTKRGTASMCCAQDHGHHSHGADAEVYPADPSRYCRCLGVDKGQIPVDAQVDLMQSGACCGAANGPDGLCERCRTTCNLVPATTSEPTGSTPQGELPTADEFASIREAVRSQLQSALQSALEPTFTHVGTVQPEPVFAFQVTYHDPAAGADVFYAHKFRVLPDGDLIFVTIMPEEGKLVTGSAARGAWRSVKIQERTGTMPEQTSPVGPFEVRYAEDGEETPQESAVAVDANLRAMGLAGLDLETTQDALPQDTLPGLDDTEQARVQAGPGREDTFTTMLDPARTS